MNEKVRASIAVTFMLLLLVVSRAWAHHGMSAIFDFNDRFTRTGTLTKIDWRNPHIYLSMDAKSAEGQVETWSFEGPSPGCFRDRNIGKSDFENGIDKIVIVEASRARDRSLSG